MNDLNFILNVKGIWTDEISTDCEFLTARAAILALGLVMCTNVLALAQQEKPNILVIWGDDIGVSNISAYHRGMMGGRTPNIDRIAKEGLLFTDYYAQQSCTAGRASFILGQNPFRTGLLTIGMPGSEQGIQAKDPTIAELLKPMGMRRADWQEPLGRSQRVSANRARL